MASSSNGSARLNNQPQPHPFDPTPPNEHAEAAWRHIRSQLTAGVLATGTPQAHLPLSDIFWHMPLSDQQWILSAFENLVNSPAKWTLMPQNDRAVCHLANYPPEASQKIGYDSRSEKMVRRAALKKVPRPLNSFILYRKARQEIVKEQYPGLSNNEISKKLGKQWREETKETRNFFKSMADKAKLEHVTLYPDYQYRPRRPEEKKRRMTQNKKRKLAERLQAEQMAVSMANNHIDPMLLDGCNMGYIGSYHPESRPAVGGSQMRLDESDFDFDSPTRAAAETDLEVFQWNDLVNLVNLEHSPDAFDGDYAPQHGVTPGAYLFD